MYIIIAVVFSFSPLAPAPCKSGEEITKRREEYGEGIIICEQDKRRSLPILLKYAGLFSRHVSVLDKPTVRQH